MSNKLNHRKLNFLDSPLFFESKLIVKNLKYQNFIKETENQSFLYKNDKIL